MSLLSLLLGSLTLALAVKDDGPTGTEEYYWPKRGGTYIGHGALPFNVDVDITKKPAWVWENREDELFRHGPVIDGKKNIYAVTSRGRIRKFSPDGELLWTQLLSWEEGKTVTSPFLYKGKLYLTSTGLFSRGFNGHAYCFDMETGERLWKMPLPAKGHVNHDSSTIHAAEDILLGMLIDDAIPKSIEGNNMLYALNASDGSPLWDYSMPEGVVWNFLPSTPGDGTFFFGSNCGVAERRSLTNGSRIWRGALDEPGAWCSTGGGTLGPNGVYYVEANSFTSSPLPGTQYCGVGFCPDGPGLLVAYRAEDGEVLWSRRFFSAEFSGMQYPAVGKINGRLLVVAAIGQNPNLPKALFGEEWVPFWIRLGLGRLQYYSRWVRRRMGMPAKRNGVAAFDADTGELAWFWEEEPWEFFAARGDEDEHFITRMRRSMADPQNEAVCGPDNWGIPAIAADGTVVVGSGSTGNLYLIRDANNDNVILDSEVSTFKANQAFLNGPALAPGLMAVAPCWGNMYVFKSDTK